MKLKGMLALDIGSVCVSLRFNECYEALGLANDSPALPAFLSICKELGKGRIDEREWQELCHELFGGGFTRAHIRDAWNRVVGLPLPGMSEVAEAIVAKGYGFAFLSDTSAMHIEKFYRSSDIHLLASGAILSYEVGDCKPSAAMYEAFERRFGVPCLYVDDLQENIDGALARGWPATLFTTPGRLLESIRRLK